MLAVAPLLARGQIAEQCPKHGRWRYWGMSSLERLQSDQFVVWSEELSSFRIEGALVSLTSQESQGDQEFNIRVDDEDLKFPVGEMSRSLAH